MSAAQSAGFSDTAPAPVGELAGQALGALDLGERGTPAELLAEAALWLALANLEHATGEDLEAICDGTWWRSRFPVANDDANADPPALARTATGRVLLRCAAEPEVGAAERAAAALGVVALGCADAEVGLSLQRGLGNLRLLDIVQQIPLAARIRTLAQEFRHHPLERELPGAQFLARVEDLLERLDREQLLARGLRDRPRDEAVADLQALLRTRSPHQLSLGRVLLAGAWFADREALLDACLADAPRLWGRLPRDAGARRVESLYGELRARLERTSWALRPRSGGGYGLLTAIEPAAEEAAGAEAEDTDAEAEPTP